MKKEDGWKFEETFLNTRFDKGPAYKSSTITSLEQFIQQLPPSLLGKSSSRKPARHGDERDSRCKTGNKAGDAGNGSGAVYLHGLTSLKADLQNKWSPSPPKEKPVTGSVLKCPLSGITVENEACQRKDNDEDGTRKLFARKKIHDKKNTENKISTSKSASNMAKSKKPQHPLQAELSGKTINNPRSRSCSHCLPENEAGCDFDSVFARLLQEKEKRLRVENCVMGLKNEVSLNQQEVQSLIQSKKTAINLAKLLKKKFEKANITNKEAIKRVKALKVEKTELTEKLQKENEKLEALENEVSLLKSGQGLKLSAVRSKVRGKDIFEISGENEKLNRASSDGSREISQDKIKSKHVKLKLCDALRKVKELKLELQNIKAVEEEKERDILKDPKVTQYVKEKEAGLKRRINILTALEAKQRTTVTELKAKLTDTQQETTETRTKLESEISHLKEEYVEQKESLIKEKAEKNKFKSLATEYNKIIKSRNDRITELSKVIEDQEQTIESSQKSREKEELLLRQLEQENVSLRHHIEKELNPQISEMQEAIEELRKAREHAEATVQDLRGQINDSEQTVCGKCSAAPVSEHKLRSLRECMSSDDESGASPAQIIGDHKDVNRIFPTEQQIQNTEFSKIISQRKKLQKDLDSAKEEKNRFYCNLKELQIENNEMLKRIGDLSVELEKAKVEAATVPQQETKLSHLEFQLRKNEKEWIEKWEKAKKEKEEAIETAKNVTDKLVNCVASYQYETANLKKVQCMLVNLLNQKDAMLAIFDKKITRQPSENIVPFDQRPVRSWLPIQNNVHHHRQCG